MTYIIYDVHEGLKLEESDTQSAFELFEDFKKAFGKNFYFRIFCRDFDYIFDRGIEYKDDTKAQDDGQIYILDGKYKVSCQFKMWPRYIEVINND